MATYHVKMVLTNNFEIKKFPQCNLPAFTGAQKDWNRVSQHVMNTIF